MSITVRSILVALVAIAIPVSAASAHGGADHGMTEAELYATEVQILGREHAEEHAEERADERRQQRHWRALTPRQQRREARQEQRASLQLARTTAARAPADEIGRWTKAPFRLPEYAIHSVMLPTGKLLFWGFPSGDFTGPNVGNANIWDPSKGYGPKAFTNVHPPVIDPDGPGPQPPGVAPIYCSGQSLLANGEVLVTGGNLVFPDFTPGAEYPDWAGLNRAFIFDPWSLKWTEQPQMTDGRWYPTQTLLADGRTVVLGGYGSAAPGGQPNTALEIFTPGGGFDSVGSFELHPEASRPTELYPHMFTLPDRNLLLAGPGSPDSAILDVGDPGDPVSWTNLPGANGYRLGSSAVLDPGSPKGSWKVTQIGGFGYVDPLPDGTQPATATTETIDAQHPGEGWKVGSSLNIPRSYQNTVLLPDDSMVTMGGGIGSTVQDGVYAIDSDGARRQIELFDPETGTWSLGPAQMEDRGYHSTAVLLPDGRVFSGGDNAHPYESDGSRSLTDNGEIYSPPYLFKGTRPVIKKAPRKIGWNEPMKIVTKGRSAATSAVLIAPAATTHANDMNQRMVELKLKRRHGREGLDVVSPPNAGVAPPGYYMLFALNRKGVPSVAKWVQLR